MTESSEIRREDWCIVTVYGDTRDDLERKALADARVFFGPAASLEVADAIEARNDPEASRGYPPAAPGRFRADVLVRETRPCLAGDTAAVPAGDHDGIRSAERALIRELAEAAGAEVLTGTGGLGLCRAPCRYAGPGNQVAGGVHRHPFTAVMDERL
jgi:hypothetical protein